ncbi:MAG TPA: GIY-YIG nuclease family protein [Candidatus Saccharimonadales bacterium]|nr:GIY-YIG nuclease family protein [Candidatus Saccharimonadales bacterium]
MLCSKRNGTLYIGVTSDLSRRIYEHQQNLIVGFTKKYGIKTLVYIEEHATMPQAITREKKLKHWSRLQKIELIENNNPNWNDLSHLLLEGLL